MHKDPFKNTNEPIQITSLEDLYKVLGEHVHPGPGEECLVCHRPYPKVKADEKQGPVRNIISLHEPKELTGTLEPMLIALVDKHREAWPREHAAMRHGVGLEVVGGRSWKYYAVHFAVYACLMFPELAPTEIG